MALQDDGHGNADAHRSDQLEKRITQLEAMLVLSKDQLQACRSIPIVPVSILRCHACSERRGQSRCRCGRVGARKRVYAESIIIPSAGRLAKAAFA